MNVIKAKTKSLVNAKKLMVSKSITSSSGSTDYAVVADPEGGATGARSL